MSADQDPNNKEVSFAETAMRLSGKSEEEATRTGAVDMADDQVEALFAPQYKTINSPIHKAVWETEVPMELFSTPKLDESTLKIPAMEVSLEILRRHRRQKTQYNEKGKLSDQVLSDLGKAGYWGLLIDKEYGGEGVSVRQYMSFLTKVATVEPTAAGLSSVHSCIGAVDPVRTFGTADQKQRILPKLASGERLSAFALTEPNAGSDLTALRTTADLKGDHYVINGEKLFITNAVEGRTVGIVALVNGKPAALIADLPKEQNENWQIKTYGLHALARAHNNGLVFKDFKVPKENLLSPQRGDGLTVAYHGLNMGRLALCATASGVMRLMLANMLPWAKFRETYGKPIETRELVKRRIARAAALICGADALVGWGSWLLDQGYRGELECIIAKIFGSEAEKECAIELFMKTHGGRSFVHGHIFGDNVHDFLAPCIYEGEGEMLGMAFFKSLAKQHGSRYFEPVGLALQKHKIKSFNPMNPAHAWALRSELADYSWWYVNAFLAGKDLRDFDDMDPRLNEHINFALAELNQHPLDLSGAMVEHQLKLPDRQCTIAQLSQRVQDAITILVTCMWAHNQKDKVTVAATDILCQDLTRALTGDRPTNAYFKACSRLADMIIAGEWKELEGIEKQEILMGYEKDSTSKKAVPAGA